MFAHFLSFCFVSPRPIFYCDVFYVFLLHFKPFQCFIPMVTFLHSFQCFVTLLCTFAMSCYFILPNSFQCFVPSFCTFVTSCYFIFLHSFQCFVPSFSTLSFIVGNAIFPPQHIDSSTPPSLARQKTNSRK